MLLSDVVLNFLNKYWFILKAAADGWRVTYIGGNRFEFSDAPIDTCLMTSDEFVNNYNNGYF